MWQILLESMHIRKKSITKSCFDREKSHLQDLDSITTIGGQGLETC